MIKPKVMMMRNKPNSRLRRDCGYLSGERQIPREPEIVGPDDNAATFRDQTVQDTSLRVAQFLATSSGFRKVSEGNVLNYPQRSSTHPAFQCLNPLRSRFATTKECDFVYARTGGSYCRQRHLQDTPNPAGA